MISHPEVVAQRRFAEAIHTAVWLSREMGNLVGLTTASQTRELSSACVSLLSIVEKGRLVFVYSARAGTA